MLKRIIFLSVIFLIQSCYYDPSTSERVPSRSKKPKDLSLDVSSTKCRNDADTGCIEGQVSAAPDLVVDDEKFFDADDLHNRFKDLINLESIEGQSLNADEYEIELRNSLKNRDFARGFQIFLKGKSARSENVLRSGGFAVHYLKEGSYDIRVQKAVRFAVKKKKADKPKEGKKDPKKEKIFCATLYADDTIEVRQNYRTGPVVFDHYNLFVKNVDCKGTGGNDSTLTF